MIALIDYEAGNIKSVENALKFLGRETVLTRDRDQIWMADKVILPGDYTKHLLLVYENGAS